VQVKPNTDGLMRRAASDSSTPYFVIFVVLGPKGILVI
jgi:hypothetical protein